MRRSWIKMWVTILRDETFMKLGVAEKWTWVGLLLLAGDSHYPGKICITENMGYSSEQLSQLLTVTPHIIANAMSLMGKESVTIDNNGVITIVQWEKYQSEWMRVSKYERATTPKTTPKTTRKKEKENEKKIQKHIKSKNYVINHPPTLTQIQEYCQRENKTIDAQAFLDHYTANGWKQSNGLPIVSWHSTIGTWLRNDRKYHPEKYVKEETAAVKKADTEAALAAINRGNDGN